MALSRPSSKSSSEKEKINSVDAFISGAVGGVIPALIFHPVDTLGKRWQTSPFKFAPNMGINAIYKNMDQILFKDVPPKFVPRVLSTFDGLLAACVYKIIQFGYKFSAQSKIKLFLENKFGNELQNQFGNHTKIILETLAGGGAGASEAVITIVPEAIKVLNQTNKQFIKEKTYTDISKQVLYFSGKSLPWTASRNFGGSGVMFGVNAFIKENILKVENNKASFTQNLAASGVSTSAMIVSTIPFDVVKNRIQSGKESHKTGRQIITSMLKNEGPTSFFRGTTIKVATKGPQATLAFAITQSLYGFLSHKRQTQQPSIPDSQKENQVSQKKRP